MKRSSAALEAAGVPAMIGGGLAAWARGGPPTDHDVDFYLREADAPRALEALVAIGMTASIPPEGWLVKAHDDDVLVDLIYRPAGGPITAEHFERATPMELMAQPVLVASIDDVLVTKLLALSEQEPDFRSVLELARSLREQIDWASVRGRTDGSPFAAAFFTLVQSLGIAPEAQQRRRPVAVAAGRKKPKGFGRRRPRATLTHARSAERPGPGRRHRGDGARPHPRACRGSGGRQRGDAAVARRAGATAPRWVGRGARPAARRHRGRADAGRGGRLRQSPRGPGRARPGAP